MILCHSCERPLNIIDSVGRQDSCPYCSRDVHCCFNCRFYDEYAHNRCLEPQSEYVSDRERANFCEYFVFRDSREEQKRDEGVAEARKRLDELFKKGGKKP